MAIALIVTSISFVGTDKVSAHQKYTTKGLVIDTSLVPQDSNISVKNKDGNEDFVNVSSDLNTLTVTGKISKLGLYEEVEPSYILDKKVTYSVDNSKVATVGESGKSLTTLSQGQIQISHHMMKKTKISVCIKQEIH